MGLENQEGTLLSDTLGRTWKFKFLPKDFPASPRSMHKNVEDRVFGAPLPKMSFSRLGGPTMQPVEKWPRFKQLFQDRVEVKRDIMLVMGKDEEDLQRYATAATFALQSNPWRFEVDLWKSFINVDLDFLENLDRKWLE